MQFDQVEVWTYVGFGFLTVVNWITYTGIRQALELGVGYETYIDVLVVNLLVQFLTVFSDSFWYIYLVIPGYLSYKLFWVVLDWAKNTGKGSEEDEEENPKKKQKKPKVKYIRS
jgi:hypothetical protein